MRLIRHLPQQESQLMKHAPCALSNPGGEQQLKLLISGAALEIVERKLNVERGGESRASTGDLSNFGIVQRDDHSTAGLASSLWMETLKGKPRKFPEWSVKNSITQYEYKSYIHVCL